MNYLVTLADGGATLTEGKAERADASLAGTTEAWISALSPVGDRRALRRGGDRGLADALLDVIIPGAGHPAEHSDSAPVAASA